jgi:hypothetical protein
MFAQKCKKFANLKKISQMNLLTFMCSLTYFWICIHLLLKKNHKKPLKHNNQKSVELNDALSLPPCNLTVYSRDLHQLPAFSED